MRASMGLCRRGQRVVGSEPLAAHLKIKDVAAHLISHASLRILTSIDLEAIAFIHSLRLQTGRELPPERQGG